MINKAYTIAVVCDTIWKRGTLRTSLIIACVVAIVRFLPGASGGGPHNNNHPYEKFTIPMMCQSLLGGGGAPRQIFRASHMVWTLIMWPAMKHRFAIICKFLAWIVSSMCAESNGASFTKKYWSQIRLWFLCSRVDTFVFSENTHFKLLSCMCPSKINTFAHN